MYVYITWSSISVDEKVPQSSGALVYQNLWGKETHGQSDHLFCFLTLLCKQGSWFFPLFPWINNLSASCSWCLACKHLFRRLEPHPCIFVKWPHTCSKWCKVAVSRACGLHETVVRRVGWKQTSTPARRFASSGGTFDIRVTDIWYIWKDISPFVKQQSLWWNPWP